MTKQIRWGILGCGKIANKFASDLALVEDSALMAVASRDRERGEAFRRKFGAPLLFNSYEDLATSGEVDAVYIATPHAFHFENTMLCLRHGKAVLCEKPMGMNASEVKEMVTFARSGKVFLMEAFWTKFLPQFEKVSDIIRRGEIGDIKLIQSDFGFAAPEPLAQRLYDPALGGGSLLDIGLYPVFLSMAFLGVPEEVSAAMTPYPSGVDEQIAMTLKFKNGGLAVLSSTFAADTGVEAMIAGTQGRIHMRNRFHNAVGTIEIIKNKQTPEKVEVHREDGFGYQFEARHVAACLRNRLIESPVMTHNDSIELAETLDRIRKACGIRYSADR